MSTKLLSEPHDSYHECGGSNHSINPNGNIDVFMQQFTDQMLCAGSIRDYLYDVSFYTRCREELFVVFRFNDNPMHDTDDEDSCDHVPHTTADHPTVPRIDVRHKFDVVLGSPPAMPANRDTACQRVPAARHGQGSHYVSFLIGCYPRYRQPLVWLRATSYEHLQVRLNRVPSLCFGPSVKSDDGECADRRAEDYPVYLNSIEQWVTQVHSYEGNPDEDDVDVPSLYDILCEMYHMCCGQHTMPLRVNWLHDELVGLSKNNHNNNKDESSEEEDDFKIKTPDRHYSASRATMTTLGLAAALRLLVQAECDEFVRSMLPDFDRLIGHHIDLLRSMPLQESS
eukprot:PhM_4_TR16422/c0_g1_i1/m.40562